MQAWGAAAGRGQHLAVHDFPEKRHRVKQALADASAGLPVDELNVRSPWQDLHLLPAALGPAHATYRGSLRHGGDITDHFATATDSALMLPASHAVLN